MDRPDRSKGIGAGRSSRLLAVLAVLGSVLILIVAFVARSDGLNAGLDSELPNRANEARELDDLRVSVSNGEGASLIEIGLDESSRDVAQPAERASSLERYWVRGRIMRESTTIEPPATETSGFDGLTVILREARDMSSERWSFPRPKYEDLSQEERRTLARDEEDRTFPIVASTTTDVKGWFLFRELDPGAYFVEALIPAAGESRSRALNSVGTKFALDGNRDLGVIFTLGDPAEPRLSEPDPERAELHVTVLRDGDPVSGMAVYAHEQGTGLRVFGGDTNDTGAATVYWEDQYDAAFLVVEDAQRNIVGVSEGATRYAIGQVTEVTLHIGTGELAVSLPHDVSMPAGSLVQVVLEAPNLPPGVVYSDSFTKQRTLRCEVLDQQVDLLFPQVLPGTYRVNAYRLAKRADSTWHKVEDLGSTEILVRRSYSQLAVL